MAATSGRTGKAGNITIATQVVNVTAWSAELDVDFADSTDSGNFSSPNLPKSQLPGAYQVTGSLEANYDASTTSTNVTSLIKAPASGPYATVLKIDASTTFFSGSVDFKNLKFKVSVPGATMVTFSTDFSSNGAFTLT